MPINVSVVNQMSFDNLSTLGSWIEKGIKIKSTKSVDLIIIIILSSKKRVDVDLNVICDVMH